MSELPEDPIPKPKPDDAPDVVTALETATALWAKGDRREGLRWLRRAAEAAEQADNDLRALEFARLAADLTGILGASLPPPMPSAPVASAPAAAEPAPEPPAPAPAAAPEASEAPAEPAAHEQRAAAPPEPSRTASEVPAPPSQAPPTPSAQPSRVPAPPSQAPPAPSAQPSQVPAARPSVAPAAGASRTSPAAMRVQAAAAALAPQARGQVRVFVKTSARDKSLYIVRPLESGKRAPIGTREAVLVFPEDG